MTEFAGPGQMADALFTLESSQYSTDVIAKSQAALADLVSHLLTPVSRHDAPARQARELKRAVFGEFGFRVRPEPAGERFTLSNTLRKRGGSCLGLTTLYVCLGESLGVPLRPMLFEGHIAVAHAGTSSPLHIEPTRFGRLLPPDVSRAFYGQPVGTNDGLLTDAELLAVHLSSRAAFVLAPEGRLDDALFLLETAVDLFPAYLAAWINLATVLFELGDFERAEESLREALALEPGPTYRAAAARLSDRLQGAVGSRSSEEPVVPAGRAGSE
jgi:tetratricopeptide (TPR) repeat protein